MLSPCPDNFLAVRSYGKVSVLSLDHNLSASYDGKSPFKVNELMAVRPSELKGGAAGAVVDMSFATTYLSDIFIVTERGEVFSSSLEGERRNM